MNSDRIRYTQYYLKTNLLLVRYHNLTDPLVDCLALVTAVENLIFLFPLFVKILFNYFNNLIFFTFILIIILDNDEINGIDQKMQQYMNKLFE
jgi:hypothetical protein